MEQKNEKKEVVNKVADKLADSFAEKAKAATGWKKWLWGALAVIAAAAAWFTMSGCTGAYKKTNDSVEAKWAIIIPVEDYKK